MTILAALWGRVAGLLVMVVTAIAALFGMRYSIRRGARKEMEHEIKEKTLERIKIAREVEDASARMSDDDINEWMRTHGYFRD